MQKLASDFAKTLIGGEVITLSGDLGFGKTTFIQGLAKGLGITRRIISPTFILSRSYSLFDKKIFYHIDLYRLQEGDAGEILGLHEILHKPDTILAIEWPERLGSHMPKKRIKIIFTYVDDTTRQITIQRRS